jgi:mono/diheme cytochrome c family protein
MRDFRKLAIVRMVMLGAVVCLLGGLAAGGPQGPDSPEGARAAYGKTIYRVYCASCHGVAGEGDGKLAQYLTIGPTDLTRLAARNGGVFPEERLESIIDGRTDVPGHSADMPVWGDAFQKTDALENEPPEVREAEVKRKIGSLLAYLRSIQVAE